MKHFFFYCWTCVLFWTTQVRIPQLWLKWCMNFCIHKGRAAHFSLYLSPIIHHCFFPLWNTTLYQENKCVSPLSDSSMRWEERSEKEGAVGEEYKAVGGFTTWAVKKEKKRKKPEQHQHVCHDGMTSPQSWPAVKRAGGRWEREVWWRGGGLSWVNRSRHVHHVPQTQKSKSRLSDVWSIYTYASKRGFSLERNLVGCFVRVLYVWLSLSVYLPILSNIKAFYSFSPSLWFIFRNQF